MFDETQRSIAPYNYSTKPNNELQRASTKPISNYFISKRKMGFDGPVTVPGTADSSELAAVAEASGVSSMPNIQNSGNSGKIVHTVFNSQRGAGYEIFSQRPMPQLKTIRRQTNEMHNFHHFQ